MSSSLGVAVIGAGMAGKAHAAAYRAATTLYRPVLPEIRLVSIADAYEPLARETAARYGFSRFDTDWRAVAADPEIDIVSVVVANSLHREIVEGLLAAGKHVLCEKPLSDSLEDARAMATAAGAAAERGLIARVGFSYLRAPGIEFIRTLIDDGRLGELLHFSGRYWTDYGCRPDAPISWRYQGPAGSGALGDVGSHLSYLAEYLCGPVAEVSGGRFHTSITERPKPLGQVVGHTRGNVSEERAPVTNDDYATFNASFARCVGTLQVSRVAAGHPNDLTLEVFGSRGAARWSQTNPGQVQVMLHDEQGDVAGYRTVALGPAHPHYVGGWAMDAPGVGIGQNDLFVHQARAFIEEVAGIPTAESLPRCRSFADGVHNIEFLAAVAESAALGGATVPVTAQEH
ncbi:Gfo/Idh/MocA family protein [Leucobacter luti]|uniref:Putative dehydrogenase n=1 Tax=Leucobacter luti TaxID=340320 RepID=A0A4Q7U0Q4_9MICO|nr:Gfo/Idh/MocA family oxidoreductase [Leucobacter luti]MBL3699415.1 gfo/Idh/MocA family oxidoreductase [Leucobacter luti]RZT66925.1 putative dehydrogenase [Leucobacter luti]